MLINEIKKNFVYKITRKVIISFFLLVFILSFFSKSLTNLTLPKVQVVQVLNNSVVKRTLKIEGTIEPKKIHKVRFSHDVVIENYYVTEGDKVNTGDPIFKVNSNYNTNSKDDILQELKLNLQQKQLQLDKLRNTSFEIYKNNIKSLEKDLENSIKNLSKQKKLYEAGAIPKSILEQCELEVEKSRINLQYEKTKLDNLVYENLLAVNTLKNEISYIQHKINKINTEKNFYSKIGNDGIYYAEQDGIILMINQTDVVINKDTPTVEIGIFNGADSVKFVGYINENDYKFVKGVSSMEISVTGYSSPSIIKITKLSKIANDKHIRIEGEFLRTAKIDVIIGQQVTGIITKTYKSKDLFVVPKSCISLQGNIEENSKGTLYIIEKEDGILGEEYLAKAIEVTIKDIGDDNVSVKGLERFNKPLVIKNLSYKISDGVRVFICQ